MLILFSITGWLLSVKFRRGPQRYYGAAKLEHSPLERKFVQHQQWTPLAPNEGSEMKAQVNLTVKLARVKAVRGKGLQLDRHNQSTYQ